MTPAQLVAAIGCKPDIAALWAPALDAAVSKYGIDTPQNQADFLATIGVESQRLTRGRENLYYTSPDRLLHIFGRHILPSEVGRFLRNPERLGNRVYANREGNGNEASGDGYRYRGGGPIGLTFLNNWRAFEQASGYPVTTDTALIERPDVGAASAGHFWQQAGCNAYSDRGDFDGVCDLVNRGRKTAPIGDANGYIDRLAMRRACRKALGLA